MKEYVLADDVEAAKLERRAERQSAIARQANQRSDNYVLMAIVFATVLFFAGISSKMNTFRARTLLLSLATVLIIGAIIVVTTFPKEI